MLKPLSLKIGVSGVRGIVGESLTPQLVTSFAAAFGTYAGAGPILVGTDTRPSREMVKQAAIAGLLSVGCAPVDLGIVPIPALQLHVRSMRAFGGICVTASHNPVEWNALKFVGADGIVLRPNQAIELTDLYHQGAYPRVAAQDIADVAQDATAVARHRETVLRAVDADAIRARRIRVAVDCCNGAASLPTPEFLRALGCEVIELYTDPGAPFPHDPEPSSDNIGALCAAVREQRADIGFAQDADADRLAIVSEAGEPLGEDCTVTLSIRHMLQRDPGPVVVNVSTSRMVDDVAQEFRCPVYRTRVGEINVVERMLECGARIGGEGNAGVIAPEINPCRDSFVAMALVLEALAREPKGATIGQLRERVPRYVMVKDKVALPTRAVAAALRRLQEDHRGDTVDLTDGVKVVWADRWVHARPSNTEPVIRVVAEAHEEQTARSLVQVAIERLVPSGA